MSIMRRAIKFAAREFAQSACGEVGRHVGDALGNLLGKRIDPEHGKTPDEGEKDKSNG